MSMQEQISEKIIALIINTGKSSTRLTAQMLAQAIQKMRETTAKGANAITQTVRQAYAAQAATGAVPIKSLTAKGDTVNSFNLQAENVKDKAERNANKNAPGGDAKNKSNAAINAGKKSMSMNPKDKSLQSFDRIARKYGVSYSVSRDAANPSQFTVFFKAKQADLIMAAQKEFAANVLSAKTPKKSLVKSLQAKAAQIKATPVQTKNKTRGELVV